MAYCTRARQEIYSREREELIFFYELPDTQAQPHDLSCSGARLPQGTVGPMQKAEAVQLTLALVDQEQTTLSCQGRQSVTQPGNAKPVVRTYLIMLCLSEGCRQAD